MPQTAAELLEAVRQLPPHQQRWIAHEILDPEEEHAPEEVEAAWGEEIKRRLDEIDSGKVELTPGDQVRDEMIASLSPQARARMRA